MNIKDHHVSGVNDLPLITVIIPVKNGALTIEKCLDAIESQSVIDWTEIIVIDSGSTDGTLELVERRGNVRVIEIPPESFNHGGTRNLGVSLAKGKYVVMSVQDAVAADNEWLKKLIRHFDDPAIAGVCGQQVVPHETDKNPHQWFRPVSADSVRKVYYASREDFVNLLPDQKKSACVWDDVNAAYRKEVLLEIPFQHAFFGEDAMWAKDALERGYTLTYDTSARVYHYHFETFEHTYKRTLTQLYFDFKIFRYRRKWSFDSKEYLKIIYRNFKYRVSLKWIPHNFQIVKASKKAFQDFHSHLSKGESSLDRFYSHVCALPPQGNVIEQKVHRSASKFRI